MKILLIGASGRMGKEVAALAAERGDIIAAGVDVVPSETAFPLYPEIGRVTEQADVIVDFSSAGGLGKALGYARAHGLPILLAATGYSDEDLAKISACTAEIPIFRTGNLSIGINLAQTLVRRAAAVLGEDFDIEIVERHHNRKQDAPSGTALMLKSSAEAGRNHALESVYGRHGMVGAREKNEIGIHAVRGGNIVGEHEVCFYGEDEIITIAHSARSRRVFASGALKAARWLIGQPAGQYDMHDFLDQIL